MKPDILILMPLIERWHDELAEEFTIHFVRPGEDWEPVLKTAGDRIRAVVTNGTTGIDAAAIDLHSVSVSIDSGNGDPLGL